MNTEIALKIFKLNLKYRENVAIRKYVIHFFEVETRNLFYLYSSPSGVVYADTREGLTEIYLLFLQGNDHLSQKIRIRNFHEILISIDGVILIIL